MPIEISILNNLTGLAGGCWQIGSFEDVEVSIQMDALGFSRLTSGRLRSDEVLNESLAGKEGDFELAHWVLGHSTRPIFSVSLCELRKS